MFVLRESRTREAERCQRADAGTRQDMPPHRVSFPFPAGKLVVTPASVPAGATTVELTLGGSTDVMAYPVALDGKVTAQVCPP